MEEEQERTREALEQVNTVFATIDRATSVYAGVVIPFLTVATGIIIYLTAPSAFTTLLWSPLVLLPLVLNLAALYWLVTAFHPEYSISSLVARYTSITKQQVLSGFMLAAVVGFWGMLVFIDESLLFRFFLFLVTLPGAFFGYYGVRPDVTNPLDARLGLEEDESG